jgi:drug/metabolite transporter (DMT)-like permease
MELRPDVGAGRADTAGVLMLVVVTALWGTTFTVIKDAVGDVSPSLLVLARFLAAALVLSILARWRRLPWRRGLDLGFWLWVGYASQAYGLQYTSASRSAFITSVSVVLVPLLVGLLGRKVPTPVWLSAAMALVGVGLLSSDRAPPNVGDLWTGVTAVAYAWFVIRLERHAAREPSLELAAAQMWGVVPFAALWVALDVAEGGLRVPGGAGTTWLQLGYLALFATALTAWLQTEGQRRVPAPEAGVIYTLEPVWAAGCAALVLGERLGPMGLAGAAVIVAALCVTQVRWRGPRGRALEEP